MGMKFGNLAKVRHVITFSLSPFEQRAFANFLTSGFPNLWRRFKSSILAFAPPMIGAYMIYSWGTRVNAQSKRKNLADFENEE
ncbi:hypothetical protein DNTS_006442 [Danionella cerebrum]|uniref:Cytochrome b-c1 complex subunit 8 n=1 Tax=Danionella cerebrum TaxID=2873325 RepID=A0A553N3X2_9TELE|nr:hypothetical protein DNTS_006442 [Danionella translucida]